MKKTFLEGLKGKTINNAVGKIEEKWYKLQELKNDLEVDDERVNEDYYFEIDTKDERIRLWGTGIYDTKYDVGKMKVKDIYTDVDEDCEGNCDNIYTVYVIKVSKKDEEKILKVREEE